MKQELEARYTRVVEKARAWCAKPGNSQGKLAAALPKVSSAVLSSFLQGTYNGSIETVTRKLEDFFDLSQARFDLVVEPEFQKTRISRKVLSGIKQCHVLRSIGVFIGPAGIGKTRTAREYVRERTGVYYLEIDPYMTNRRDFMRALCEVLDVPAGENARDNYLRLREKAAEQGALLILDEAQRISSKTRHSFNAFEVLRSLNDAGVGIALIGNNRVRDRITTNHEVDFYQQFCSRSEVWDLNGEAVSREEVKRVIQGMYNGPMDEEVFDCLFTAASEYVGSLRILIRALNMAVLRANAHDDTLTLRYVQDGIANVLSQKKPQPATQRRKLDVRKEPAGANPEREPKEEQPVAS